MTTDLTPDSTAMLRHGLAVAAILRPESGLCRQVLIEAPLQSAPKHRFSLAIRTGARVSVRGGRLISALLGTLVLLLMSPPAIAMSFEAEARARFESVNDQRYAEHAEGLTWRLHAGAQTTPLLNTYLAGSAELVGHAGDPHFNDGIHDRGAYPEIGDPDAEEIDELFIGNRTAYASGRLDAWAGRRAWFQDRQRYLGGGPSWRQNAQSWEGAGVTAAYRDWVAEAVVVGEVRRPGGNHSPRGRQDLDGRIVQLTGSPISGVRVTLFGHWLDYAPGPAIPDSASNRTLGGALAWSRTFGGIGVDILLEAATQRGWHAPVPSSEGNYRSLEMGVTNGPWRFVVLREVLSGDGQVAFQTPLAGLHAYNGHADRFLRTPADGLDDRALSLGWKSGAWNAAAAHHWYRSTEASYDFGSETDASIAYALPRSQRLMLKWARYKGEDDAELAQRAPLQAADVEKFWMLWEWKWRH